MIDWIKRFGKNYPEFWKNYLESFNQDTKRFVSISLQTTGLNPEKDLILSIASIGIVNNAVLINDVFEVAINQSESDTNNSENEFLNTLNQEKLSEVNAIQSFINFISNATLVGHRINFDIEIINTALEKYHCGRLKNDALDIEVMYKKLHDINDRDFSINDLSRLFKIEQYDRTSTADDAYTIALLYLKLKSRLGL